MRGDPAAPDVLQLREQAEGRGLAGAAGGGGVLPSETDLCAEGNGAGAVRLRSHHGACLAVACPEGTRVIDPFEACEGTRAHAEAVPVRVDGRPALARPAGTAEADAAAARAGAIGACGGRRGAAACRRELAQAAATAPVHLVVVHRDAEREAADHNLSRLDRSRRPRPPAARRRVVVAVSVAPLHLKRQPRAAAAIAGVALTALTAAGARLGACGARGAAWGHPFKSLRFASEEMPVL